MSWFGLNPSTAQVVGPIIEGEKMLQVGSAHAHHETCVGGVLIDMGGVMARRKVPNLAGNEISTINKGWW